MCRVLAEVVVIVLGDRGHGGADAVGVDPPRASISKELMDCFSIYSRGSP